MSKREAATTAQRLSRLERDIEKRDELSALIDDQLEALALDVGREHDAAFSWTAESERQFRALDAFLVRRAEELCRAVQAEAERMAAAQKAGVLRGAYQLEGRLQLADPFDDSLIPAGLSEPLFSAMVERTNAQLPVVSVQSESPLAIDYDGISDRVPFPEGNARLEVCPLIHAMRTFGNFALSDILALDRAMFVPDIRIRNCAD